MRIPNRGRHWAERRADQERADGIPDRPSLIDTRQPREFDMREDGGDHWMAWPIVGLTSYNLREYDSGDVVFTGTMKQCLRWVSRKLVHRLGVRNL